MTETLANGYSSERAQQGLSNEYQQGRVRMDFKHLSDFITCVKIAAALKGLMLRCNITLPVPLLTGGKQIITLL